MTYATGLGSLPALLEARGGSKSVARAFASQNLPLVLVSDRTHRVPLAALIGLFDCAARLAGDPRFGLHVGLAMAPHDYGRWAAFAMQAPTLSGALSRLARCVVLHQVGGALVLQPRPGGRVLWEYRQSAVAGARAMQHTDHVIPVMLRVLRAYCGADWTLCSIETSSPDRHHVRPHAGRRSSFRRQRSGRDDGCRWATTNRRRSVLPRYWPRSAFATPNAI